MASRDHDPSIGTALESYERLAKAARERYQRDTRFRYIVQSIVNRALTEHGPVDPQRADRDAARIAENVAALVLETIFRDDAELNAQRGLADHYRKIAEDALALSPMQPIIVSSAKPTAGDGSRDEI